MRTKAIALWGALWLCAVCTAGCGAAGDAAPADGSSPPQAVQTEQAAPADSVTGCLVDGAGGGELLLAEQDGSRVCRFDAGTAAVSVDGAAASAGDLTDGMTLTVSFGAAEETWPLRLTGVTAVAAKTPAGGGYTDLCGLYLQVLEDLWDTDPALSDGLRIVGVDLSGEPGGLTESEKAAVAWRFGEKHGLPAVCGTFGELAARGCIDRANLQWTDGCLFSITADRGRGAECCSLPVLTFDAEKWRSGTGAYFFSGCTCVWPEMGSWSGYQVGSQAIS